MMEFIVKMRNPISGKTEVYSTEATDREDLQLGLDFWEKDARYTILVVTQKNEA